MTSQDLFIKINSSLVEINYLVTDSSLNFENFKPLILQAMQELLKPLDKFLSIELSDTQQILYLQIIEKYTSTLLKNVKSQQEMPSTSSRSWALGSKIQTTVELDYAKRYIERFYLSPIAKEIAILEDIIWPRVEKYDLQNSLSIPVKDDSPSPSPNKI